MLPFAGVPQILSVEFSQNFDVENFGKSGKSQN